jgi:hypothetical protein
VKKPYRLLSIIFLLFFLEIEASLACRYNVRETGFINLGAEAYYLYVYANQDTLPDIIPDSNQISDTVLADTNVKLEVIDVNQQGNHPALKYLALWQIQTFPSVILISPEGQSLAVPVTKPNQPFRQTLQLALEEIIFSPKRQEIIQKVAKTYGAILLIEGPDEQANKMAKGAANAAVKSVALQMEIMPKPIARPPEIVVIDWRTLPDEKILLWSLGLELQDVNGPYAAIFYGRGRWIGPLFEGQQITEGNLASILFVIGSDCECGLDYRWLRGTMLPVRWDQKIQAQAAESLGFDPESPTVKMEMSWIINKGIGGDFYPSVPLGYQEFVMEPESENQTQQNLPAQVQNIHWPTTFDTNAPPENSFLAESKPVLLKPLYFIVGLAALTIVAGLIIVLRATRRNL